MLQFKPERAHITDYAMQRLSLCGKVFVADMAGALYWPGERTLVVADLHHGGMSGAFGGCRHQAPLHIVGRRRVGRGVRCDVRIDDLGSRLGHGRTVTGG